MFGMKDVEEYTIPTLIGDKEKEYIVPENVEKEEFVVRMKALSEQELEWLMDIIPISLCLQKIEQEVAKVENYKRTIKDISKAFD